MKFKARVAVQRDGKTVYWTASAIALRMCLQGFAKRRGQGMIELPAAGSPEDLHVAALERFQEMKPDRHCYGAHTPPNKDRKTYAPCFYRAATGLVATVHTSWRGKHHVSEEVQTAQ
jgi:hypothetical protein